MAGDGPAPARAWMLAGRIERFMTRELAAAVQVLRGVDPTIP